MGVVAQAPFQERRLALVALFVVSGVGLIFEITLTRLFSLFFQYHFTFLAVSLAVLGLSLGAASAHYLKPARRSMATITGTLIALSLAFSAGAMIIAWLPSAESIFPRALVALVIFFLIGLFDALIFEHFASSSGSLYAADLIGAALGVVAVLGLLSLWSAFSMTLFLGALVGVVAVLFALRYREENSRLHVYALGSTALGVILLVANLVTGVIDYNPLQISGVPRDKTMIYILQDQSQEGKIIYTGWSPFARVDVVQTNDPSSRYIFADGGAGAYMLAYDGNPDSLAPLENTVEYLPFTSGSADQTLVIGAGGGKDVLLALHADAQKVTAVEVNPAIVAATRHYADYNGNIFDLPQVDLVEGDARSFVERSDGQFDLIYLNLVYTQAVEPASQALVENYIFTRQAFRTYLEHLAPGGRLAIISHNALEGSRAALTAIQAMQDMGIAPSKSLDHLWMWMTPSDDSTLRTSVLVVGKDALPAATITSLNQTARAQGMQPLFAPGDFETLFEPLRQGAPMVSYIQADADYNLGPTDDDQPYFFNLDYGLPPAIRSALIMAALLAVGLTVVAFVTSTPDKKEVNPARRWTLFAYAALIGAGFMLVEVPLIQRFQLLMGQPILSLAVVLATLLLAGGLGSWVSQRWLTASLPARIRWVGLWITILAGIYWVALPSLVNAMLMTPFGMRLLVTVILTALLGFPMGMPFPSLLRMGSEGRQQVALLWAINGAFSVLGSALAMVISMQWGFKWALLTGAGLYLLLAVVAWLMMRAPETAPMLVRKSKAAR
jgi:predicted membrane-bound spermidine synthase